MGRCIYCDQPAGFLKIYHEQCHQQMNNLKNEILKTLEIYETGEASYFVTRDKILGLLEQKKTLHAANRVRISEHELQPGETVIYAHRSIHLEESKNTCKMTRTGLSYEKHPIWNVTESCLDDRAIFYMTDSQIIFYITDKGYMKFPFKKIVNCGNLSNWGNYPFFDVATSSPYPHRFTMCMVEDDVERKILGKLIRFMISGKADRSHRNESKRNDNAQPEVITNKRPKHKWLYEEDKLCCKVIVEEYVLKKSNKDLESVLDNLSDKLPDIGRNSLRMKTQNIKQLLMENGIENTLRTKGLYSYSAQNKRAFDEVLNDLDIS